MRDDDVVWKEGNLAKKLSAGLLLYRRHIHSTVEILLVHPGGPFWAGKDEHAWSIPKGEHEPGEDPEATAGREFEEELGASPPSGQWIDLGEIQQPSRKIVRAWAVEGDFDPDDLVSNTFELMWPPGSGVARAFPEVDKAAWFDPETARAKLHKGQVPFVGRLLSILGG